MSSMHQAYVALGANLGDAHATVRAALDRLDHLDATRLVAASSIYRTAPVGCVHQPDFFNAVARLETRLEPQGLLAALLALEADFGRTRRAKNDPRTLDLDLLLFDDLTLNLPSLTLPHPRLHLRAFVLVPLAEIAPDLVLPGRGNLCAWLPAVANQSVTRLP
ncbi:MAG: 2-amino-4-hydroxy-6-hydroxymethyldihydropteridine pyrophosphokinase [Betaproteobacteria bacterium ADurb.Bin341]|nr:MAG: 2-amino-4-hydroxy-6-hydroxymethyldihydropteridine pyrophosphokinase [Betaproteobacteria bacterium ADurb.Bin341]